MGKEYRAPRGTQDVLPADEPYWDFVEATAARLCARFGYGWIETPIFEDASLFTRGVGDVTDIVKKEMYVFEDRGGQELALRPEATAPICRAYLQNGMHSLPQPVRLWSVAPIFRYDRPQAGRYREHHQFDVEAIGEADAAVDAEIVELLWRLYEELGLTGLTLNLNTIGDYNCRPAYLEVLRDYYRDKLHHVCGDCRQRFDRNPLRLLDCKVPGCRPVIAGAPAITDYLCDECAKHFADLKAYLEAVGIPFLLNPRLVRGLDYYTRTVFEVQPKEEGGQSSIGGGGRYDGLIEAWAGTRHRHRLRHRHRADHPQPQAPGTRFRRRSRCRCSSPTRRPPPASKPSVSPLSSAAPASPPPPPPASARSKRRCATPAASAPATPPSSASAAAEGMVTVKRLATGEQELSRWGCGGEVASAEGR
jgi:histidyl-tRNA synthetase